MENCNYNKTRLLAEILSTLWRLERGVYAEDAKKAGHPLCGKLYEDLAKDLRKYKEKLIAAIEGLSKEGKFK
ncbi:MAG: hypothetical protein QXU88_02590 [Candidatus Woesearchaeota archaeon]